METTVFLSNRSQAVRLPKAVALPEDVKRVEIIAVGRTRIITTAGESWDSWFDGEDVGRRDPARRRIGVPLFNEGLGGADALYSCVQMPPGVPVATVAIGGAKNAGVLAAQIIATGDEKLAAVLADFKRDLAEGLKI